MKWVSRYRPHGEADLRHPEPNFYIVGNKSYGRAPTFLLMTGYEQVRSVVAALVGDWEAAQEVRLVLPETGVCNVSLPDQNGSEAACCTPALIQEVCCTPAAEEDQCCTPVAESEPKEAIKLAVLADACC